MRKCAGSHLSGNNGKGSPSRLVRPPRVLEGNRPALSERGQASDSESDMVVSPRVIQSPHIPHSCKEMIIQPSSKELQTYQISEAVLAPDCSMTSGATTIDLSGVLDDQIKYLDLLQYGLPTTASSRAAVVVFAATPKSASLTQPSLFVKIFAPLISRCITP